jgi:predicted nicotinamide N-methyase
MNIIYPTQTVLKKIKDKVFVLEVIKDLDAAIDQLCDQLSAEGGQDPFAEDLCPYFGILWPASVGLAQFLAQNPELVKNKKVLEIGCGPGLPSLAASYFGGDVLATDFHPDAQSYFLRNCRHSSIICEYKRFNWREESLVQYDVLLGSDILYESKHPQELIQTLLKLVKKGGTVILSDPSRSYLSNFRKSMRDLKLEESLSIMKVDDENINILVYRV